MHERRRLISSHAALKCLLTLHGHLSVEFLFTLASHHFSPPLPLEVVYQNKSRFLRAKEKGVQVGFDRRCFDTQQQNLHHQNLGDPALLSCWLPGSLEENFVNSNTSV